MQRLRLALQEVAAERGAPEPLLGFNIQSSAQHLEFATTVQDVGMSEVPGIVYRNNSHLAFYRLFEEMERTMFPIKPPLMYFDRGEGDQASVRFTPENRIATSEVLMSDALSFVFPGRYTDAPYTNNHFESEEETALLEQIDPQVRPVYWASQHYCGELAGQRLTNTLLLWSVASEPSPAGTLLEGQYIGYFNAVGQALDRLHIPYRSLAIGDRFFTAQPSLQASDLEGISLVVLPAARNLSAEAKGLLVDYVRAGGQVLAVGRAGYSDTFGADIPDDQQPEGWAALFALDSGQQQDGAGTATTVAWPEQPCSQEEARWNREEERDNHRVCPELRQEVEGTIRSQLDLAALRSVEAVLPEGVVLDTLRAADGSLVIKLHNRNFDDQAIVPASGSISIDGAELPADYQVSWFKLGHYAESLDSELVGELLTIPIPEFSDFALVRVGSQIRYRHFEFAPTQWRSDQED